MSGLSQLLENTQGLNVKSDICALCFKNPPRSAESNVCAECFVCSCCGTSKADSMSRTSKGLICAECMVPILAEREKREVAGRIESAGFYKAHERIAFDLLDERQKKVANQYLGRPFGNLIINGNSGSGKTWTAIATAKRLIERGSTAKYLSVPWMFAFIRDCIGHDKNFQITEYVNGLLGYDYIILDDLGAHRATDWAIETLYLILDQWESHEKKGLICTTNLSMDEIAKTFSDRIASRLAASCKLIKLDGDDKRIK